MVKGMSGYQIQSQDRLCTTGWNRLVSFEHTLHAPSLVLLVAGPSCLIGRYCRTFPHQAYLALLLAYVIPDSRVTWSNIVRSFRKGYTRLHGSSVTCYGSWSQLIVHTGDFSSVRGSEFQATSVSETWLRARTLRALKLVVAAPHVEPPKSNASYRKIT